MRKILLLCSLFLYLFGNDGLDELSLESLMDIKIHSATKSYERVENIPANVIVITRKDIEKFNFKTLNEVLNTVPGLFVLYDTEHYQIGTKGSLGSSFKLMLNDNPIMTIRHPYGGTSHQNFFATPIEAIDRIEIVKGSQAVTYGTNSMYGSINVITNDFNEKNIFSMGLGTNGNKKFFSRVSHANDFGGFTINSSFYNTDGIQGNIKDAVTDDYYDERLQSAIEKFEDSTAQQYKTLDFSYAYKDLTLGIDYSKSRYGIFFEPTYTGSTVDQTLNNVSISYESDINDSTNYKLIYIKSIKNYDLITSQLAENFILDVNSKFYNDFFDLYLNHKISDNLKILLGLSYEKRKSFVILNTFEENEIDVDEKSNYKQIQKDIYTKLNYTMNSKLEFNLGLRHTRNKKATRYYSALGFDSYFGGNVDIKREYDLGNDKKNLPEFSIIYHLDQANHFKFLYGKTSQLKYQSDKTYEDITSKELIYMLIKKNYMLNYSLFENETKNISVFTYSNDNFNENAKGSIKNRGFEFSFDYKKANKYDIKTSLTYQKPVLNSSSAYPSFSPKLIAKVAMSYIDNKTTYSLYSNYISSMKSTINSRNGERYGKDSNYNLTVNTSLSQEINKDLRLNYSVTNLFDRDNRMPAGTSMQNLYHGSFTPGRILYINAEYKF